MAQPSRAGTGRRDRSERAPRRSHAERTAETRAKILAAVVESIAEVGLARTTAAEIERRAGMTWGAVQHHFGGKDDLLLAVLEDSFAGFADRLRAVPVDLPLRERADRFVRGAFEHFTSPDYHATFEILLWALRREDRSADEDWRGALFADWQREWLRLFGDAPIPRERHPTLQHYAISVLVGLGWSLFLEGARGRPRERELDLLVETLTRELGDAV